MQATGAGTPSRWMRLGLAAGGASIGAVALSLLIGVAPASASDDEGPAVGALVQQLGGTAGGLVETVTDPVDSVVNELGTAIAPVADAAQPITAPVVERVAPVVRPVVQAPPIALEVVRESVSPVTEAVAPVLEPLAPITDPVERAVDAVVVELVLDQAVAPIAAPVAGTVDGVLETAPVVGELLGETPVTGIVEPVIDPVPGTDVLPSEPGTGEAAPAPELAPDLMPELAFPPVDGVAAAEASAPLVAQASMPSLLVGAAENAQLAPLVRSGAFAAPAAEAGISLPSTDAVHDLPSVQRNGPDGVVPSGASGTAAGVAPLAAVIHDHPLPALAAGRVGALESDRAPSSLAEEHTASPD